jgi:chromosomal replication initiator protein
VLLVDDIHFIEKKESTQEECFHTFNALRDSGKQIVISADRPPKAFANLAERLRSRFEWGLICDVQIPDFETRLAILQKKCQVERIAIDASVLEYIASVFTTNIRELEGALIKANAYSTLTGKILDRYSLANILQPSGTLFQPKPVLTIDKVIATVAEAYKVEASEIRSSKRSQDLALPRHIAMHLACELMQLSTPRIGQAFENRKHSSVIYAHNRVKDLVANDPSVAASVASLKRQLGY